MLSLIKNEPCCTESFFRFDTEKNRLFLGKNFGNEYLTKRELDILNYVLLGYTAKKIACVLHISYRTVESYLFILKLKLGCSTKGELIEISIKTGLFKYFFR